jgi:hypothetical protein
MSVDTFRSLVRELGKQVGKELRPEGSAVGVEIDDVAFTLIHGEPWGEENVLFACDFGEVSEQKRCAALTKALEANMHLHGPWSPIFALAPETGYLTLMAVLPMASLDTAAMWDTLVGFTGVVKSWRNNHFLEGGPAAPHQVG